MQSVQPVTTTIAGAREMSGLSTSTLYRLFDEGRLKKIKVKGRTLIRVSELMSVIDGTDAEAA